ncbi:MAG TPA: hypothetical protein VF720_09185 [Candidatus Eisenbacteria bacterium]
MAAGISLLVKSVPARAASPETPDECLRRLVSQALASGSITDDSLMVDGFSRSGLDPLSSEQRAGVREHLDLFAPVLAQAQAPSHSPGWDIQILFLEQGTPEQRAMMTSQLRRWFTEDVRQPLRDRSVRYENAQAIREVVLGYRVTVAEMLAEYGDRSATRVIREWSMGESMETEDRDRVIQALARLEDPCHRRWLIPAGVDRVEPCDGSEPLTVRACHRRGESTDCGDPIPAAAARALDHVMSLVPVRRAGPRSEGSRWLSLTGGGRECRIEPAANGKSVIIAESDMHEFGFAWEVESAELAAWVIGWMKTAPR